MISFEPLRDYCYKHKIKLTRVVLGCDLSKNIVTRINNDLNIELKALERICLKLNIPVQDAVVFLRDD